MRDAVKSEWQVRPLGEVVTLNYGKALARSERDPNGSIPVYGANGVMDWSEHTLTEGPSFVIGRKGSAGEVTRVDGPFWPSDVTYYTTHDENVLDFNFLHYTLQTLNLPSMARGVKPGINRNDVYALPISLPSLEEQQRLVEILDEAFEGLSRARAHAEANLQNARDLFETSLSAFIDRHKDSWSSTTLGEAYDVRDGTHDSPKYHPTGRALITSKNLGRDGLHFEKVKFISEEDFVSICRRSGVDKGDVLFAMIGTIGNPIVVDVEPDFAIKNVALFKMKDGRNGQFLRYMLRSIYVIEKMKAEAKGTTQQFVGLGYLRSFPIILPEPTVELTMVDELDRIEAQCRSAEALYENKLQGLDDLRQSLLQKAFAGELT